MNSSLYRGHVAHERHAPVRNRFRYGIYYLYADLGELDDLSRSLRLFSHNGTSLVTFQDRDHGPRDGTPLRPWIDGLLARAGVDLEGGAVRILTFPRVLGFKFYPVAFWYCFHADGTPRAVLAEVQNTFGEHHNYLLHKHGEPMDLAHERPGAVKAFHVSPFIELDARYEFRFTEPGDTLAASIYDYVKGPLLLVAAVSLDRRDLTDGEILRTVLRYGPMSLRAWLLIHLQAIRIVMKRIRYVPHTPAPEEDTSL